MLRLSISSPKAEPMVIKRNPRVFYAGFLQCWQLSNKSASGVEMNVAGKIRKIAGALLVLPACLFICSCTALAVTGAVVGTAVGVGVAVGSTAVSATSSVVKAVVPGD